MESCGVWRRGSWPKRLQVRRELLDFGVEEEPDGAEEKGDSTDSQSASEGAESESQVAAREEGSNEATGAVLAQWDAESDHGGIIEMTSSKPTLSSSPAKSNDVKCHGSPQLTRDALSKVVMELEAAVGDAQAFEVIDSTEENYLQEEPLGSADGDADVGPIRHPPTPLTHAATLGLPLAVAIVPDLAIETHRCRNCRRDLRPRRQ